MTAVPVFPHSPTPELQTIEWTTHRWFRVLSHYFSIATSGEGMAEYIELVIGPFATTRDRAEEPNPPTPGFPAHYEMVDMGVDDSRRFRLYYNGVIMSSSIKAANVFDHFFWHVNAEAARRTGEFVLIHAGAVGTPAGSGMLIPGVSGTGKSTLVSGLLHAGFTYYSDEAAAIDPIGGRLHSYPKAITLKDRTVFDTFPGLPQAQTDDNFVHNRWYLVPGQIRPGIVGAPTAVGYVVISRFEPGISTKIERIGRAEAALALGQNVINLGRYKSRVLPLLSELVDDAQCLTIEIGDLEDAVDAIAEFVSV